MRAAWGTANLEFVFGDHVLDVDRRELRRRGERISLEPQVFDLLVYLVRNANASSAKTTCCRRSGAVE
jgi:DNA-binding winged helix-turn-helix (wHTH) protein